MIPSREQLVQAYAFYATRANLEERARRSPVKIELPLAARPAAIDAALAMAHSLVSEGIGEVAAVLYALARHPRCFPFGLLAFTTLVAKGVANGRGLRLHASSDEFRTLIMSVTENKATPGDVALWVDMHCADAPS